MEFSTPISSEEMYRKFPPEAPADDVKPIEDMIKDARLRKGLSQKDLASLINLSTTQTSKIENGQARPSKQSLRLISFHLGLNYRDMLLACRYSDIRSRDSYFDADGNEIDVKAIVDSIYEADASLLLALAGISKIGSAKNIEALKLLIEAYRKEDAATRPVKNDDNGGENGSTPESSEKFPSYIVDSVREHIISLLGPLVNDDVIDDVPEENEAQERMLN